MISVTARRYLLPALFVTATTALAYTHSAICSVPDSSPHQYVDFLSNWSISLLVVWWVRDDSRESKYWPCFDYDMFLLSGWLFLLPHYLVRTRGAKGLLVFAGMMSLFLIASLAVGLALTVLGLI
jgi:hypothetical protein